MCKEPKTWRASKLTSLLFLRELQIIRGSHRIILWRIVFIMIFFFLLHNTLKIFADLVSGFSCSGRTLIGKMRANACS